MSKSRKEQLIEEIKNNLKRIEELLVDTPDQISDEEYLELIKEAELAKQSLEILLKM